MHCIVVHHILNILYCFVVNENYFGNIITPIYYYTLYLPFHPSYYKSEMLLFAFPCDLLFPFKLRWMHINIKSNIGLCNPSTLDYFILLFVG